MCDPVTIAVSAVAAGSTIISANEQADAIDDASDAQTQAANDSIAYQRETRDLNLAMNEPFRQSQLQSLNAYNAIFGFDPVNDNGYQAMRTDNQPSYFNEYTAPTNSSSSGAQPRRGLGSVQQRLNNDPELRGPNDPAPNLPSPNPNAPVAAMPSTDPAASPAPALSPEERFEQSLYYTTIQPDAELTNQRLDSALSAQGLRNSSANLNASNLAAAKLQSNAFQRYFNGLMGSPSDTANSNALTINTNFANNASNTTENLGNNIANNAYASGNVQANMWAGLGTAGLYGLGGLSEAGVFDNFGRSNNGGIDLNEITFNGGPLANPNYRFSTPGINPTALRYF